MSLEVGSRLGHYTVDALIGEGGMGQVYQATDTKLNRQVALKILPEAFASDPDRLARFQREAQVLASLNHPGIAQIHGLEEQDGTKALVLELVEGPTLADRIAQGPIPVNEALPIAKQIAEALEAAHEQGVIHRDLKPANIKVREDGTVKVLDFGLAKALSTDASEAVLSDSPTVTATVGGTRQGVILGTAAYMSPEQARGRALDKRCDVWAFGCVMFEMLTSRPAFGGSTLSDTLASILERDPDWDALPPATPHRVRDLLRRCLDKRLKQRWRDIGDARIQLEDGEKTSDTLSSVAVPDTAVRRWRVVAVGALAALVVISAYALTRNVGSAGPPVSVAVASNTIATQLTNYGQREASPALSPDGRSFAFVSDHEGTPDIWRRQVSGGDLVRLTDDAETESRLAFSPDGDAIYFQRAGAIWRIGSLGGQAQTIVSSGSHPSPAPDGRALAYYVQDGARLSLTIGSLDGSRTETLVGGIDRGGASAPAWSPDGRSLVFRRAGLFATSNLFLVDVETGNVRQLTDFETAATGIQSYVWLPDNRHMAVAYVVAGSDQFSNDLGILDVEEGSVSRLTLSVSRVFGSLSVAADGSRLIAVGQQAEREVWRVPYGPDPVANGRAATRVLDRVVDPMWTHVSRDGKTLLYNTATSGSRNLWVMPLNGSAPARQVTRISGGTVRHAALSPDGDRVAFVMSEHDSGSSDVWVQNLDGTGLRQLTDDDEADSWPAWSPDGRSVLFSTTSTNLGRRTRRVPVGGGVVEDFLDGGFEGDVISKPEGTGAWLVTFDNVNAVKLIDYESKTVVWEERFDGLGAGLPVFSPDGRLVSIPTAEGPDQDGIWVLDSATGERRRAVTFPGRFRIYFRAAWTDEGRAFIVNRYEPMSHVMLFDNFWPKPVN